MVRGLLSNVVCASARGQASGVAVEQLTKVVFIKHFGPRKVNQ